MSLFLNTLNNMNSLLFSQTEKGGGKSISYTPYGGSKRFRNLTAGFNGQRVDPVSQHYHLGNGARSYNPVLMRFNSPDRLSPFGAGGINPYTYCLGDPINRSDPSGHISWQAGLGIGLGVLGIIATAGAAAMAISAAGGIGAALSAASTTSLLTGSIGVAGDAIGIASGAVSDTNPELSATLGWLSMGAGIVGATMGGIAAKSSRGGVNIRNSKPILHYKAFNTYAVSIFPTGKTRAFTAMDGYVNDFRGTRAPAIFLHGSRKGEFAVGKGIQKYSYIGKPKTKTATIWFSSAEELAEGLETEFSLNLKNSETPLYVVSCYARRFEKELATAFERPIITFSTRPIRARELKHYLGESSSQVRNRAFMSLKPKLYMSPLLQS